MDRIKVLFFGPVADAAAVREVSLKLTGDLTRDLTASKLLDEVKARFPMLSGQELLVAVDREYAKPSTKISPGCEVAIFTPVSGG